MIDAIGFFVFVLMLVLLNAAVWAFGVDPRDPCERDPFSHHRSS
jgi:hypothetical protein